MRLGSILRALFGAPAFLLSIVLLSGTAQADGPAMTVPGQFSVSATGAATYSVPIAVPPGTGGMVPGLRLDYSSQDGDGMVGLGWALNGLPQITRCPRTLAQDAIHGSVNYDANDRFCLEGQRLIGISGTYGADGAEYRTEIDGFTKIVSHGTVGSGPDYFTAITKNGQTLRFGYNTDSKFLAGASVRVWALDQNTDTKKNYFTVTYDYTNNQPTRIDYTGNGTTGLSPYNSVQFSYSTTRVDNQLTPVLMTHIKTYQGSNLVYDYQLAYRAGTSTTHSRLTSVTLCDGGVTQACLAPTTFTWQGGSGQLTMTATAISAASGSLILVPIDLDGDGLTDAMVSNDCNDTSADRFYMGTLSSGFTLSSTWALSSPAAGTGAAGCTIVFPQPIDIEPDGLADLFYKQTARYTDEGDAHVTHNYVVAHSNGTSTLTGATVTADSAATFAFPGDFNGDGRSDYFVQSTVTATPSYAFLGTGTGTFTADGGHSGMAAPANTLAGGDFNGDGCTDVLAFGTTNIVTYFCQPAVATATAPSVSGFTPPVIYGDFNGDGKTDLLYVATASTGKLYLSTGTGFASAITTPTGWGNYTVVTGDWNGDGKTDILLVAFNTSVGTSHSLWLSTGSGFVQAVDPSNNPITISHTISTDYVTATAADWNSDGASDFWIQQASGDVLYTFANVPETITAVTNGIGATTSITYDRLNKNGTFYTKGAAPAYPLLAVDGPFYVVSQAGLSDTLGGTYVTNYSYVGAFANNNTYTYATSRYSKVVYGNLPGAILGFSSITATDPQTGIVTTTNYRNDFPYRGLVSSQTRVLSGGSPVTLSSVVNTFASATGTGVSSTSYYDVTITKSVASGHDADSTPLPTTTTDYLSYDAYDNPLSVKVTLSDGATRTVTNTYTNDPTNWILGQTVSTTVLSTVSGVTLTRVMCWQRDAAGAVVKEFVAPSALTPCTASSAGMETDYTLDGFGNRLSGTVSGTGVTSRTTAATYTRPTPLDATGRFALTTTDALGHVDTYTYDERFGGMTGHLDPNNLTTAWSYDTFGRKTLETRPDGTKTAMSYAVCGGAVTCPTHGATRAEVDAFASDGTTHIGPTSYAYYDALGRGVASDTQGLDGSNIRVETQFDSNLRLKKSSRPYFTTGGTPVYTVNTAFDPLGRPTTVTAPDASTTTYTYSGLTTSVTDALSHTTTTVRNAEGGVASVTDALSHATTYTYDSFGQVLTVTDPLGNVITNVYDAVRGNKTDTYDPDMGHWVYTYDVLGELLTQVDAKSQTTTMAYDLLGRSTTRTEADLTTTWTWGSTPANHDVNRLISTDAVGLAAGSATADYTRTMAYDSAGRPVTTTFVQSAQSYTTAYNATNGQIDTVTYPSGFAAKYLYNAQGYLCRITDSGGSHTCSTTSDSHVVWTAGTADAELHLLTQTAGNAAFTTTQTFDGNTGAVKQIFAGPSNTVAQLSYTWDSVGNLIARQDGLNNIFEMYCHDSLNRLTESSTATGGASGLGACSSTGPGLAHKTIAYDAIGNITNKSDVGGYTYLASGSGSVRPHAVSSITGTVNGVTNPSYTYDANGNMLNGATRNINYTSFNMAGSIGTSPTLYKIVYDGDHMRFRQNQFLGGTLVTRTVYKNDPVSGAMEEVVTSGSTSSSWNDYISIGGRPVAERSCTVATATPTAPCTGTVSWQYFVTDHLGSVATVTNAAGAVLQNLSYDAWGLRRNHDGTDNTNCSVTTPPTTHGYTGHEHIESLCDINANARIYDPTIARFLSADTMVPDGFNGQAFNRFSYVGNNPLSFTDPSGHLDCDAVGRHCKHPDSGDPTDHTDESMHTTGSSFNPFTTGLIFAGAPPVNGGHIVGWTGHISIPIIDNVSASDTMMETVIADVWSTPIYGADFTRYGFGNPGASSVQFNSIRIGDIRSGGIFQGASMDIGLGGSQLGQSGSIVLMEGYSSEGKLGGSVTAGYNANVNGESVGYPSSNNQSSTSNEAAGADAGRVGGIWFSNATTMAQTRGDFAVKNYVLGIINVQFATSGPIWVLSIGPGGGIAESAYHTNTVLTGDWGGHH